VDAAEFDHWLSRTAALSPSQQSRAWQAFVLSEASEVDDGSAGDSLERVPERIGIADTLGEPRAAVASPVLTGSRQSGAVAVAATSVSALSTALIAPAAAAATRWGGG
jgi:hypothetical protein